ncbi:MAG: hypothetical protein E7011_04115 [Alphaproteobacteria bacterium]|nr:hypothetical protein [Alphaproteobacteria bacterium]
MVNGYQPYTIAACRQLTNAECKNATETLAGAATRRIALIGLHGKLNELQKRHEQELCKTKPDVKLIKRIEEKITAITNTLNNCKIR